ncbi:MAG: magnesium transporter CorA family protein [Dethiobacter sp.]|jgi:magnesium transporter|nr:magnesium transporter CorA family protein [Dethiobacter sp.]
MLKKFQLHDGLLLQAESEESPIYVYINPDATERDALQAAFKIDNHTLSSALDPDEISRIEFNQDHLLLIWKRPASANGKEVFSLDVASVGLLLYADRLLVISTEAIQIGGSEGLAGPELRSLFDVMLSLLSKTIHDYTMQLKSIKLTAKEVQQKINTSFENKHLIKMFDLSEGLVYFINGIGGNGAVLTRLRNYLEKEKHSPHAMAFIDDLIIENTQCYRQAGTYSTVFAGLMDARGNIINNNMNILIRNLTLINIVFLPLNLIAGIGGMSEFTMMTEGIDWRISYSLFSVALLLIGGLTAFVLKKTGFGGSTVIVSKRKFLR